MIKPQKVEKKTFDSRILQQMEKNRKNLKLNCIISNCLKN